MRKYVALVGINFKSMLSNFAGGKINKKRATTGIGALLLMAFIAIYLSGVYSFLLGSMLAPVGMLNLVPVTMALASCLASLMFTAFAASGIVFGNKDSDLMLSLPLSSFSVMLSKIIALYLENLFFGLFMMLPAGAAYLFYGGEGGIMFVVRLLLFNFILPLLPTTFALLVGFILAFVQAKMGRNALLGNLFYLAFFALIMIFSFKLNTYAAALLQNGELINGIFSTWLLPLGLYRDAIFGNWLAGVGFVLMLVVPFLLIVYLFSIKYKKILTILSSTKIKQNYKLTAMKSEGQTKSLIKKEFGRYFGTPIYVFNTSIGVIIAVGAAIYSVIMRNDISAILMQLFGSGEFPILMMVCGIAAFCCALTATSCISISLEGKTLWILKEAPISAKTLFLAKASVNIALILTIAVVGAPLAAFGLGLSVVQGVALALLCASFAPFVSFSGLIINLFFPKMDGTNDTLIVKQSISAMLGVFLGFGVMGIGVGAYFMFGKTIGEVPFIFACSAVLLIFSVVFWQILCTKGVKLLKAL